MVIVAAPPTSDSWISWGINPTKTWMMGAEVIIVFKDKTVIDVKMVYLQSYIDHIYQNLSH